MRMWREEEDEEGAEESSVCVCVCACVCVYVCTCAGCVRYAANHPRSATARIARSTSLDGPLAVDPRVYSTPVRARVCVRAP